MTHQEWLEMYQTRRKQALEQLRDLETKVIALSGAIEAIEQMIKAEEAEENDGQ